MRVDLVGRRLLDEARHRAVADACARARRRTGPRPASSASVARAPRCSCSASCAADVEVGEHVAVEHQEALVEQRLGELQRAAGAERLRLLDVAQAHAVRAAVAEHVAHAGREEAARHDDVVDAVARAASRA